MARSRKALVKELDRVFSLMVRYSNSKNGYCQCITCGRKYPIKQIQCGHFMSRKNYSTRWELENVAPQCYSCNVMQQGRQYEFAKQIGEKKAQKMLQLSKQIVKFSNQDLLDKIAKYKKIIAIFDVK